VDQINDTRGGKGKEAIRDNGGRNSSRRWSAGGSGRARVSRASWGFWLYFLFSSATLLPSLQGADKSKPAPPEGEPKRTVTIKIALAEPFGIGIDARREVRKLNRLASEAFSRAFGIEFRIITWDTWKIDKSLTTTRAMLDDLRKKVDPGGADILIGVLGPSSPYELPTGIADYLTSVLMLRLGGPGTAVPIAIHELGHIFGAVDLDEKNTVMNPGNPRSRFDTFSARVISLNKGRSFHTQTFPCPRSSISEVIAAYEDRASLGRSEPEIHLFLAYLYIGIKDYAAASRECVEVLKANAGLGEVHSLLGYLYLAQGRTNEAIAEYRMVLEWNRERPVAHFNLGIACAQGGNEDEATAEFREALRLNPSYAEAHASLGQQLLKSGEVEAGLDHARTAVKISPGFPEGLCILATALILKESASLLEEAATICRKAVALKPGLPEAHSILGVAYGFMEKNEEAEAELLRTLELKPDSLAAHLNLAVLFRKTGREDKAAYHLGRVVEIDPDFAAGQGILGANKIGRLRYMVLAGGMS
jgi:tetratricopeptide (TPR) repeat protein